MNWTPNPPKTDGLFWVVTSTSHVTIVLRKKKKIIDLGGCVYPPDFISWWGDAPVLPEHGWSATQPEDDGWYGARYNNKKSVVCRVTWGTFLHGYDFTGPEMELSKVVAWNGPLVHPSPPPAPKKHEQK